MSEIFWILISKPARSRFATSWETDSSIKSKYKFASSEQLEASRQVKSKIKYGRPDVLSELTEKERAGSPIEMDGKNT